MSPRIDDHWSLACCNFMRSRVVYNPRKLVSTRTLWILDYLQAFQRCFETSVSIGHIIVLIKLILRRDLFFVTIIK